MFFVRFIPTFPVLHRSTFVFRECTQPLLLNAMAIGSLYLGPKASIAKVVKPQLCLKEGAKLVHREKLYGVWLTLQSQHL